MVWKYLSQKQLQEVIGDELLERLESVIPMLGGVENDPLKLYSKNNLIRIFNAFMSPECFRSKEFRKNLLNAIPADEINKLCRLVNVDVQGHDFEGKVTAICNKGWSDHEFCANFLDWAGLPPIFLPPKITLIPNSEYFHKTTTAYKVLKDYQFQVYSESLEQLKTNLARFVIQMPTGSGKTRTAMEFITEFLNSGSEDRIVLWLAHSQELCEQSVQCFKDVWSHVAKKDLYLYRCWGSNGILPFSVKGSAFIVAGFQKLYSIHKKNKVPLQELSKRIGLVIVDEAHKVTAPTYKEVTKALIGASTKLVGLTATPGRSILKDSENDENALLAELFFNRIISIKTLGEKSVIEMLREKKIIAKVTCVPLLSGRTYELSSKEKKYLEESFDFPEGFLDKIANDNVRNLEILKRLDKETKTCESILFFACSVEHSKYICSLLLYLGYKAAHIDGSTGDSLRRQIIEDFKSKKIQIVCNYGILSTGFDAPQVDLVFISRPTGSLVLYSQMIGRGLRGPAIGGKEKCKLIDVKDNIQGFPDYDFMYEYFHDYWTE